MKLTVLVDNHTYIDRYYLGEPALSFYIEEGEARVLFDVGYSDVFLRNADALGIDLRDLTHVVLSHGHDDHTRGLFHLRERVDLRQIPLIAHPDCFLPRWSGDLYVGPPYSAEQIAAFADVRWCVEPLALSERLLFLGEIPRRHSFEQTAGLGRRLRGEQWEEDNLSDDSALVYKGDDGLFIITGCSHSGICNIVDHAKAVCGDDRISGIIGGFHLFADDARLRQTINHLAACRMQRLYPCHCVSLAAKARMLAAGLPVAEVGVSLSIDIP